ncbi:MAG: hypothetical protein KY461_11320, partial [Actinobacteria bacterium]|nr:hypothetical protein [Actinomycetota bacterium]
PDPMPRPDPEPMPVPDPDPMPRPDPEPMPVPDPDPVPAPDPDPIPRADDPFRRPEPRDHIGEDGRWALPASHRTVTGANLEAPPSATIVPDGPDDDVRVTAALQTLAQEVWSRDDEA